MLLDIAPSEMLLTVMVAVVVVGPKDMPRALRMAGRWIGKMRRVSGHFRAGLENMIREAELEEMERKWREQNEAIMKESAATAPAVPALTAPEDATGAAALLAAGHPVPAVETPPADTHPADAHPVEAPVSAPSSASVSAPAGTPGAAH